MAVKFSANPFAITLTAIMTSDEKTSPVGADRLVFADSADGNKIKLTRIDKLPIGGTSGVVSSFNGRTGAVMPTATDYTFEMVGAAPQSHTHEVIDILGFKDAVEILLPDMSVNGTTPLGGAALLRGAITNVSLNNQDKIIILINISNSPVIVNTVDGFTLMNPDGSDGGSTYSLPNGGTKAIFWRRTVQQWMRIN